MTTTAAASRHLRLLIAVVLIALVIAVFFPLRHAGFIELDDPQYVVENRRVSAGLSMEGLRWALTSLEAYNWHPLTWVSHMIDVRLFGMDAGWHHLVSVLLHAANAVLLFALLARMTGALWRSALVAALFAAHPLHVESVAWIAERKDVLSALLGFLTVAAYLGYLRRPSPGRYLGVVLAFALGLMAKPMLVTLPVLLLLLDYWPLARWGPPRALLVEKAPLFALAAASAVVTSIAQARGGSVISLVDYPIGVRIVNATVSLAVYLGKTIWPAQLAVIYPHPGAGLPWWKIALAAAFLLCGTAAALTAARRLPFVPAGWLWFLVTLLPVIGLVQVGDQAMADRYTYLPHVGIFIVAAWGAALLARRERLRPAVIAVAMAATVLCAAAARNRVGLWCDSFALFTQAVSVTRDNWAAHSVLGGILADQGRLSEAETHDREVVRIRPLFANGHNNLGAVLSGQGRADEAFRHYREAMRLDQRSPEPHYNMGVDLAALGATERAVAALEQALRLRPGYAAAWYQLGLLRERQGRTAEAAACYRRVLQLQPGNAAAARQLSLLAR